MESVGQIDQLDKLEGKDGRKKTAGDGINLSN
jgi:hypothetical protein